MFNPFLSLTTATTTTCTTTTTVSAAAKTTTAGLSAAPTTPSKPKPSSVHHSPPYESHPGLTRDRRPSGDSSAKKHQESMRTYAETSRYDLYDKSPSSTSSALSREAAREEKRDRERKSSASISPYSAAAMLGQTPNVSMADMPMFYFPFGTGLPEPSSFGSLPYSSAALMAAAAASTSAAAATTCALPYTTSSLYSSYPGSAYTTHSSSSAHKGTSSSSKPSSSKDSADARIPREYNSNSKGREVGLSNGGLPTSVISPPLSSSYNHKYTGSFGDLDPGEVKVGGSFL